MRTIWMTAYSLIQIIQKAYARNAIIGEHFKTKVDYTFDEEGNLIKAQRTIARV